MLTNTLNTAGLAYYFIFALFCLVDLRYRSVAIIKFFFWGAVLISILHSVPHTAIILLAVGWGLWEWTNFMLPLLLFYPAAWPVLLYGYTLKQRLSGGADLLSLASITCLYSWPGAIASVLGVEVWRRWWRRRYPGQGTLPGLPGMFVGLTVYIITSLILFHFGIQLPSTP